MSTKIVCPVCNKEKDEQAFVTRFYDNDIGSWVQHDEPSETCVECLEEHSLELMAEDQ